MAQACATAAVLPQPYMKCSGSKAASSLASRASRRWPGLLLSGSSSMVSSWSRWALVTDGANARGASSWPAMTYRDTILLQLGEKPVVLPVEAVARMAQGEALLPGSGKSCVRTDAVRLAIALRG